LRNRRITQNKWLNKTLKCILDGKCPKSTPSKQTLSYAKGYHIDTSTPTGPQFAEIDNGDFILNSKSVLSAINEDNATIYYSHSEGVYNSAKVINKLHNDEMGPCTTQDIKSGNIHEYLGEELLAHVPTSTPNNIPTSDIAIFPNLTWIHDDTNLTLFLPATMNKPTYGKLHMDSIYIDLFI
jgi:hypothetical protein